MSAAEIQNAAGRVVLDPAVGSIAALELIDGGRALRPLHRAPWIGEADLPTDLPLVEQRLSGDFLCMPFGASDVEPGPPHGWTANAAWEPEDGAWRLSRPVMGAAVTKRLTLGDGPVLYQTHVIEGGSGAVPVAHHTMTRMAGRGRLSFSPKRAALAADPPLEPDHALAPGGRGDPGAMPAAAGGTLDLRALPIGDGTEDFVTLVEDGARLGWTAVVREAEDDVVIVLRDATVLPVTMLWHSNGGRGYPPWSGRHRGVLGIEDGRAAGALGHAAALDPGNPVARLGVPTALTLGPRHVIRHAVVALSRGGWSRVSDVSLAGGALRVEGDGGEREIPFDPTFLDGGTDGDG